MPKNRKIKNHFLHFKKTAKAAALIAFVLFFFVFVEFFFRYRVFAQTAAEEEKKMLKQELENVTKEIEKYENLIKEKKIETQSLNRDVYILSQQIKEHELEIKQSQLALQDIREQIELKTRLIFDMDVRIETEKELLSEYLRQMYDYGTVSLFEVFFLEKNISGFFFRIKAVSDLQEKIGDLAGEVRDLKNDLESEREYLEQSKLETIQLRAIEEFKKRAVEQAKQDKNILLSKTKGQEKAYQVTLKESQKTAAQIRNKLYLIEGGGDAITFGQALDYAEFVESKTGIRPAFLLALLQKESSKTSGVWGDNVGTGNWKIDMYDCYVANGKTSKATQLKNAFLEITSKLGLDPDKTIVSKSDKVNRRFCGGAMGPAQFMPTTWIGYADRIAKLSGNNPPNPWVVKDAFTAAGIYLFDKGANSRTYDAEFNAAARYYGGQYVGQIYARDVMRRAANIQDDILVLKKSM